jgi:hypothetical protein
MTSLPRSNVLPEAEAGVGDEQGLAAGVDRSEGEATPSQPRDSRPPRQGHGQRVKCQVCGRMLVPLKSGLHRNHVRHRRAEDWCQGSGYRAERWPVDQLLRHHSGDLWQVLEDRGGQWGDYFLRCLLGREQGRAMVAHGEYMHRHGWTPAKIHKGELAALAAADGVFV